MNPKRIEVLDWLKAIGIIVVIVTHVLSRNLGSSIVNNIWNYLHFVVPIFVFASGYLMYWKYQDKGISLSYALRWFKKRSARLLVPYYAYLLLHYAVWFLFPTIFSGYGLSSSLHFFLKSLLLIGIDYGWLPLLFLQLMFLTPLFIKLFQKSSTRIGLLCITGVSSFLLVFIHTSLDYHMMMWIPWSFIYLLSFEAARIRVFERKRGRLVLAIPIIIACFTYGFLSYSLISGHNPLTLTLHKYPPDMFYLSYAIGIGGIITLFLSYLSAMPRIISIISERSYDLFFAHYIGIDVVERLKTRMPVSLEFQLLIVLGISSVFLLLPTLLTSLRRLIGQGKP